MKKKVIVIVAILLCLTAAVGGTLAYYTVVGTARNVITTGGIGVEVVEQQLVNGEPRPYPPEPIQVVPGISVSKIVSARSLEQPAWVRMSYTATLLGPDGKALSIAPAELAKLVIITPDSSSWTEKDGWWYYKDALAAGELSAPLFESVSFSGPDMGNEYQNCTLIVNVTAQAVQKANNGESVMAAAGWPAAES